MGFQSVLKEHFPTIWSYIEPMWEKIPAANVPPIHDRDLVPFYQSANATTDGVIKLTTREILFIRALSLILGFGVTVVLVNILKNSLDPTRKEKQKAQKKAEEMMTKIGVTGVKLTEYELCVAVDLICPSDITVSWESIGGLTDTIREVQDTVILPLVHADIFTDSKLLTAPKGVLLYGPPGCGKTMIAKATARAAGIRFINFQVHSMMDKWYGETQKRVAAIYSLAVKIQPIIIFIDEIDAFLRNRSSTDHEATAMMKTQFMAFWDGLITDPHCQVIIMGATNRPNDVDPAILRRMPSKFYVPKPNITQRADILKVILEDECVETTFNYDSLAVSTQHFSGSDLREMCRLAAMSRVQEYFKSNKGLIKKGFAVKKLRPITVQDCMKAVKKMRQTDSQQTALTNAIPHRDITCGDFLEGLVAPPTTQSKKEKKKGKKENKSTGTDPDYNSLDID